MNEELKIIIKAVTSDAKKGIQDIKKELGGVSESAKSASSGIGKAIKGIGTALKALAIMEVVKAVLNLGKASLELQRAQAKLNTAFQSVGASAQQAAESYNGLFRFLGDNDRAVEAASHLARLTTNQQELAEWTKVCQGIYATFGDSLPIEGLTEAANESARVGKVTGTLADALNWAGVSEDEFNAKLATTVSFEEREALIRSTLNGLYSNAAEIYEKNNKALLEHNESQARVNQSLANTGAAITPLLTALNNLSAALLDALKPAFDVIIPAIATVVDWLTKGIQAVMGFFGVITGASTSVNTFASMGSGISSAATGASNLASGLEDSAKAAEKAKRAALGFDELNIVPSGSSSGSGAAGADGPGYMAPTVDASKFTMEVEQTENQASGFAKMMKDVADQLKDVFAPTVTAWSGAFDTVKQAWEDAKPHFINGAKDIASAYMELGGYLVGTFVPDVVNSFSTNLAPIIGDLIAFKITEVGKTFEFIGEIFKDVTSSVIIPALDLVKQVLIDTFDSFGQAWDKHGEPFIQKFSAAFENTRKLLTTLYESYFKPIAQKIIAVLDKVWTNGLKPLVDKAVDAALEIGECLLDLYNKFIYPIADWIARNVAPIITDVIEDILDHLGEFVTYISRAIGGVIDVITGLVQFLTGVFTGDWKKAWEGVKNIFKGVWDVIVNLAKAAWESIKAPFSAVGTFFTSAWNQVKSAWSGVKSFFSDIWTGIKNTFSPVSDWFKNTFTKAWTNVKNVFSTGGKIFDGIKDGILSGLKTIVNGIIDGINRVIKVPFNGINSALSSIRNTSVAGLKPFSWLPSISVPTIPKLARGGIVDQATLAMIGERGKEAVVPLENNTEWLDKLAERLASLINTPSKIVLMLDGRELGWANINSINNITRQTGALQLTLV